MPEKKPGIITEPGALSLKLQRGNVFAEECNTRQILQDVTSKWGVLILLALMDGTHRFGELRLKIVGVSEKMLSQTLAVLEKDGFVTRKSFPVIPPHVEYSLTSLGQAVAEKVRDLADWIELNIEEITNTQ